MSAEKPYGLNWQEYEAYCDARDRAQATPRPVNTRFVLSADDDHPYNRKALEDLESFRRMGPKSGRNTKLLELAGQLGRITSLRRETLVEALIQGCKDNNLWYEDGEKRCMDTINRGLAYADTKPPRGPTEDYQPPSATTIDPAELLASTKDQSPEEVDLLSVEYLRSKMRRGGVLLDIPAAPPSLWGKGSNIAWSQGESLMLTGRPGLGKTTLAGALIHAQLSPICDGRVLDLSVAPVASGKTILYLGMDRPEQIKRNLARHFSDDDRELLDEHLVIWEGPPPADLAKMPNLLARLGEAADAAVIYVDSLKDAAIGLSEDAVAAGYNRARQHALAEGYQLCELHHTVKRTPTGGAPSGLEDVYGSMWLTAGAGSVLLFTGDAGDPIVGVRHVKQPVNEIGPLRMMHDAETGSVSVHHETDLVELARLSPVDGLTARSAAVALFGGGESNFKPTAAQIEKARRSLVREEKRDRLVAIDGQSGLPGKATRTWFCKHEEAAE